MWSVTGPMGGEQGWRMVMGGLGRRQQVLGSVVNPWQSRAIMRIVRSVVRL